MRGGIVMKVTGRWGGSRNDQTGAGYGIRIRERDRKRHFDPDSTEVTVDLDGQEEVAVDLTPSFWRSCIELRSPRIGAWMLREGLAPWPTGHPPELELEPLGDARFRLYK